VGTIKVSSAGFDCAVENSAIIRYIIEVEAVNRNPKRDALVVPHFFQFILPPERMRQPPIG
jgi:hypothetical protein